MVFRSTPQLGPGLEDVIPAGGVWFDVPGEMTLISPRLGDKEVGTDGHDYVLVVASAAITSTADTGTAIVITETDGAFTAAAGADGGFHTQPDTAVPNGAFFWARKDDL